MFLYYDAWSLLFLRLKALGCVFTCCSVVLSLVSGSAVHAHRRHPRPAWTSRFVCDDLVLPINLSLCELRSLPMLARSRLCVVTTAGADDS